MLDQFPITKRWPAKDPGVIQLYSKPTPNGIKVSAMLEECGVAYEPHAIDFATDDQRTPEFLSLNPNNKIPAIIDPNGPGGEAIGIFESGAILLYLAEKTGKLMSADPATRVETIQWLMWQMGGAGPMFGQFGFFYKFAGREWEDKRPMQRYRDETRRLLAVLEARLKGREFMVGDAYSIADIATWPWVRTLGGFYGAADELALDEFPEINRWFDACTERPASQIGMKTPA